jgi:hypothetical protein
VPNQLDGNGLQVASLAEIVAAITAELQGVYGADINVNPNSPDGQMINIFAQAVEDMLETLLDVYNIFFVDNAYGVALDNLVALNGLARKAGSFTRVWVQVTVNQALTLPGTDTDTPFTVADDAGNQYRLVTSYAFGGAETATLLFQAALLGQIQVTPNTLTNVVTTTFGVTGVNNPAVSVATNGTTVNTQPQVTGIADTSAMTPGMLVTCANFPPETYVLSVDSSSQITCTKNATASSTLALTVATPATVTGTVEETDIQLKVRRAQSFYLQAVGPGPAIRAALLAIADVVDAYVAENDTGSDADGVPAHGIWVIVNGGTADEIAQAIASKKAPGCDMAGAVTHNVVLPQGNTFTAKWDTALSQPLFIQATLNPRFPGLVFDLVADAAALAAALQYRLGQSPSIGDVIQAMAAIEPNAVLSSVAVSDDGVTWVDIVSPSDFQHFFTVAAGDITLS